jgi:hypothetical protein
MNYYGIPKWHTIFFFLESPVMKKLSGWQPAATNGQDSVNNGNDFFTDHFFSRIGYD